VDINPILIKPEADARAQVIVMGKPLDTLGASAYYQNIQSLWEPVTCALDRLRASYDLVIIEGAGSPVEINIKAGDIVNMAVAQYAQSPVLLVGDIDRGGIFAQMLGTLWLLEPDERSLVRGLVVNKFRGDLDLFKDGIGILEERGGVPVLGVIPFLKDLKIPEEDAVALDHPEVQTQKNGANLDIAVIHLPLISNFDDFDPLDAEAGVNVRYVTSSQELGSPDAIILPGTKSTIADLSWLRSQGLASHILDYAGAGGAVVGICGGYQIMGEAVSDPLGVEAKVKTISGLGLLPIKTEFSGSKATFQARARIRSGNGWLANLEGQIISGYEIHMGRSQGGSPWMEIIDRNSSSTSLMDGGISADGLLWGCYLHGLFQNTNLRQAWLSSLGWQASALEELESFEEGASFQEAVKYLADSVEASLDMDKLEAIIWGN